MANSGLAIAAVAGLDGTATLNVDVALAVKRDGTWVQVSTVQPGPNWVREGADIVYNQERTISNSSGSDQSFSDAAIIASQDLGQTISFLNTNENAVDNLVGPISAIPSGPHVIADGQTLRFTELRISL